MDIAQYNRKAWDGLVERGNEWTRPVTGDVVAAARRGEWQLVLTPRRPVPAEWFPRLQGVRTLCLAGAGGQQGPVLAAAGAIVTVLDNSPKQLAQDDRVARRERLHLSAVLGDMRDLGMFPNQTFSLIVHPCSNCFVPEVTPVWREAHRVLEPGGILLAGFINPVAFIFDETSAEKGELSVRHRLPYSDLDSLSTEERDRLVQAGEPWMFSHSLEDLIGGQTLAGFAVTGLYEDEWPEKAISKFMPTFIATRAIRLARDPDSLA